MLLDTTGSLIAFTGKEDSRVTAAIAGNIWASYEACGKRSLDGDELDMVLLECGAGRVVVNRVSKKLLLCLYADATVEIGMLKLKAEALTKHLEEPLQKIL